MHLAFTLSSIVLAVATAGSAVVDFRGSEKVEDLMRRLGHRPNFEHLLGAIKVVGALGLVVGLVAVHLLGVVAALCFVAYFLLALRAHRIVGDPSSEARPALILLLVSLVTVITGALS
jgi:uncharacterized membrane protein YphA (DoxX/SURF4 family)